MRKIFSKTLLLLFLLVAKSFSAQAQEQNKEVDLIGGLMTELETLITTLKNDLKKNENEQLRNDATIIRSKKIKNEAENENNLKAQEIAIESENTAKKAKEKNVKNAETIKKTISIYEALINIKSQLIKDYKDRPASTVVSFKCMGNVKVSRGRKKIMDCSSNIFLEPGDFLETEKGSSVDLFMKDGSKVRVNENTLFKINENDEIEVALGRIRNMIRTRLTKKITVRTPSAVTSVRGTQFETNVTKEGDTEIHLFEGEVEIEVLASKEKITLKPGQKIFITKDGKTDGPVNFDNNTIKQWWEE